MKKIFIWLVISFSCFLVAFFIDNYYIKNKGSFFILNIIEKLLK